jgi:glycosyltransferase involved in cell wall biosynthesis
VKLPDSYVHQSLGTINQIAERIPRTNSKWSSSNISNCSLTYHLKVLHIIPSISPKRGGPSKAIWLVHKALTEQGIHVSIATTDDDGPGRHARGTSLPFDTHVFPKQTEFYTYSSALKQWLIQNIRNYDLVHIHALFSYPSIVAGKVAQRAGVPYIVRPLGTLNRYGIQYRRPLLKKLSLRLFEGPLLRQAAAVHFTAQAEMHEAKLLGIPLRPAIVPLSVVSEEEPDYQAFYTRHPDLRTNPYVLFLSRLDQKKNIEGLLGAFAQLVPSYPNLRLAIVGDGDPRYLSGLKSLAQSLKVAPHIVWTGFLSGGLKSAALAGARVFVLPSYSENFGIAAAEALLQGLPCVLGRGVAIAGDVEAAGAGIGVEPTVEAISQALQYLLDDDSIRAQVGARARAFAEKEYSLDVMGSRLMAMYENALNGSITYDPPESN